MRWIKIDKDTIIPKDKKLLICVFDSIKNRNNYICITGSTTWWHEYDPLNENPYRSEDCRFWTESVYYSYKKNHDMQTCDGELQEDFGGRFTHYMIIEDPI